MKRTRRTSTPKALHRLVSGPWEGYTVALDASGDGCTGWLTINGSVGRYNCGTWEAQS